MAKADTGSARAPRGSKVVTQAFFTALDAVPAPQQAAVGKAAQTMIRDEFKTRREKASAAAAKLKARTPAKRAAPAKAAPRKAAPKKAARGRTPRASAAAD